MGQSNVCPSFLELQAGILQKSKRKQRQTKWDRLATPTILPVAQVAPPTKGSTPGGNSQPASQRDPRLNDQTGRAAYNALHAVLHRWRW
jgi:hypothetical protein